MKLYGCLNTGQFGDGHRVTSTARILFFRPKFNRYNKDEKCRVTKHRRWSCRDEGEIASWGFGRTRSNDEWRGLPTPLPSRSSTSRPVKFGIFSSLFFSFIILSWAYIKPRMPCRSFGVWESADSGLSRGSRWLLHLWSHWVRLSISYLYFPTSIPLSIISWCFPSIHTMDATFISIHGKYWS